MKAGFHVSHTSRQIYPQMKEKQWCSGLNSNSTRATGLRLAKAEETQSDEYVTLLILIYPISMNVYMKN